MPDVVRVLHTSDLHGHHRELMRIPADQFDLWIDTGDFLPNHGRIGGRIQPEAERRWQLRWWANKQQGRKLAEWLDGRPALCLGGNHDFIPVANALRIAGVECPEVTTAGVKLLGLRFAGFREIPYIIGEWAGETHGFRELVEASFAAQPDVLLTHAPPLGVLDGEPGDDAHYGISELTTAFCYTEHTIRWHLFGHVHGAGGRTMKVLNTTHVNSAQHFTLLDLEVP